MLDLLAFAGNPVVRQQVTWGMSVEKSSSMKSNLLGRGITLRKSLRSSAMIYLRFPRVLGASVQLERLFVHEGQEVDKGEKIAQVRPLPGNRSVALYSPVSGVVSQITARPIVNLAETSPSFVGVENSNLFSTRSKVIEARFLDDKATFKTEKTAKQAKQRKSVREQQASIGPNKGVHTSKGKRPLIFVTASVSLALLIAVGVIAVAATLLPVMAATETVCADENDHFVIERDGYSVVLFSEGSGSLDYSDSRVVQEFLISSQDGDLSARAVFSWPIFNRPSNLIFRIVRDGETRRISPSAGNDLAAADRIIYFSLGDDIGGAISRGRISGQASFNFVANVSESREEVYRALLNGVAVRVGALVGSQSAGVIYQEEFTVEVPQVLGGYDQSEDLILSVHPSQRYGNCIEVPR